MYNFRIIDQTHCYAYFTKTFSSTECKEIIKLASKIKTEKAQVSRKKNNKTEFVEDHEVRKCNIKWITQNNDTSWIYDRIIGTVLELNKSFFGFDISTIEDIQFTNYKAPDGFYREHVDRIFGQPVRKISFSVQLTEKDKYEGGDLILNDGSKNINPYKNIGDLVCFPSYILHEVTPVTKGERNALVGWIGGKNFK